MASYVLMVVAVLAFFAIGFYFMLDGASSDITNRSQMISAMKQQLITACHDEAKTTAASICVVDGITGEYGENFAVKFILQNFTPSSNQGEWIKNKTVSCLTASCMP